MESVILGCSTCGGPVVVLLVDVDVEVLVVEVLVLVVEVEVDVVDVDVEVDVLVDVVDVLVLVVLVDVLVDAPSPIATHFPENPIIKLKTSIYFKAFIPYSFLASDRAQKTALAALFNSIININTSGR